jgi:hypothetical protein
VGVGAGFFVGFLFEGLERGVAEGAAAGIGLGLGVAVAVGAGVGVGGGVGVGIGVPAVAVAAGVDCGVVVCVAIGSSDRPQPNTRKPSIRRKNALQLPLRFCLISGNVRSEVHIKLL